MGETDTEVGCLIDKLESAAFHGMLVERGGAKTTSVGYPEIATSSRQQHQGR